MIRKIPTKRSLPIRIIGALYHALENSWPAVIALYAAIFAIVFAANFWGVT